MPISLLEVVDTAIKIGLGAGITAVSSLLLSKQNHDRESQKERIKKERELLEKVAEEFESFSHKVFAYWSLMVERNRTLSTGKVMAEDRKKVLADVKRDVFAGGRELTNAEAKLLLLGQQDAQEMLRVFADLVREFRRKVFERDDLYTEEELLEWREKIIVARQDFFKALSTAFQKL